MSWSNECPEGTEFYVRYKETADAPDERSVYVGFSGSGRAVWWDDGSKPVPLKSLRGVFWSEPSRYA